MNETAPPPSSQTHSDAGQPPPTGPRVTKDEVFDLGSLRRTVEDRHIAGVAGGLARHLDVDPILIRVGLVVAAFFGGAGLLIYLGCWLLVPEETSNDRPLGLDSRNRAVALVGVAVLAAVAAVSDWASAGFFPWPIAIVAFVLLWFLSRKQQDRGFVAPWATGGPGVTPPYGTPGTATDPSDPSTGSQASYAVPASQAPASYGPHAYAPPPPMDPVTYRRPLPSNPRRRGPILFWFTLALIALGIGTLGVVDLAGLDVAPSAYPALALGISTLMLGIGAFWGRAGGLILVSLISAVAMVITSAASTWESDVVTYTPTSSAQVVDDYRIDAGELIVDLSQVNDIDDLDGRTITVDVAAGRVEVIVPDGLAVVATTDIGAGASNLFGSQADGVGRTHEQTRQPSTRAPQIHLTIDIGLGEAVVRGE